MLLDQEPSRSRAFGALLAPTFQCVAAVVLVVLGAGAVAALFADGRFGAPASFAMPAAGRLVPADFLAHAIAAQTGLLLALAALLARFPASAPLAFHRGQALATTAGAFGALGLNAAGSWAMARFGESYLALPEFRSPGWTAAIVLNAVLAAPLIEELFFREVLLARVLAPTSRLYALGISSIAFGALHIPAGGPVLFVTLTLLGAVFGWLRLRTGSLAPAIIAHAANNLIALVVAGSTAG